MASDKNVEAKKKLQKSYFDVMGLCCSSEVPLIENILKSLDGVKDVSVIVPSRTVIVLHDNLIVSQLQIVKALNQARLEANVRSYGDAKFKKKWPSPYTIICGILLLLSLLKYLYHPLQWLAIGAVAVGILPIALKGIAAIRNFTLDINILALIAVGGTIYLKDYLEAGTIVFLFSIAEWLESRASHKATAVMSSLMNMAPQKAVIAETGEVVDADEVKVNTVVVVKAGEVIPIDGIVVQGKSEVDEKTLTGESFPVPKEKDSIVWAGTINLNGYISVMTTALAEDCVVAKMAKLVEEAQNSKTRAQRFIDRCAKFYTPAVVCISVGMAVIPAALRVHNQNYWFHLALVVLVSACPCALILSTPVATFCALSQAATSGLLIKGGDYLEIMSKIKTMAFDKTGTITRGEFVVTNFRSLHGDHDISFDILLYWVSSIESKSSHPMAAAIVEYGRSNSIEPKPEIVEEFHNYPGEGIHGKIGGKDIYVGNKKIAQRAKCENVPDLEGDEAIGGKTTGYIYYGATPAGVFSLADTCRTGVMEAIKELRKMGIKTAMLTGDSNAAAMHAQEQLGHALELVHAELLPEDKARIIEEFKRDGPTAMIGDGINDAPALATADIGIAMGISGSALATETGQVILMSNDIRKIPKAVKLARRCHKKVIQNVVLSITTKVAILVLAFVGHPLVWAAVLADVGTCLIVILNSMMLLRGSHNHEGKGRASSKSHKHKHECHDHSGHASHKHDQCHDHSGHTSHKHACQDHNGHVSHKDECHEHSGHASHKHDCHDHGGHESHDHSGHASLKHDCHDHSRLTFINHKCHDLSENANKKHDDCHDHSGHASKKHDCRDPSGHASHKHEGHDDPSGHVSHKHECHDDPSGHVSHKHECHDHSGHASHAHQHQHQSCSESKGTKNTCEIKESDTATCKDSHKMHNHGCERDSNSSACGMKKCKESSDMISRSINNHLNHGQEEVCDEHHHCPKDHDKSDGQTTIDAVTNSCIKRKECCDSKKRDRQLHHHASKDEITGACNAECWSGIRARKIGGCCKSYRKECCASKHGHFGHGLSEIVIQA